jgi:hypothetical protein
MTPGITPASSFANHTDRLREGSAAHQARGSASARERRMPRRRLRRLDGLAAGSQRLSSTRRTGHCHPCRPRYRVA